MAAMKNLKKLEDNNPTNNVLMAADTSSQQRDLSVHELLSQLEAKGHKVQLIENLAAIPEAPPTKEDMSFSDTADKKTLKERLKQQDEQLSTQ